MRPPLVIAAALIWTAGWSLGCAFDLDRTHPLRGEWSGTCNLVSGTTIAFDLDKPNFDDVGAITGTASDPVPEPVGAYGVYKVAGSHRLNDQPEDGLSGSLLFCEDKEGCAWPPDRTSLPPNFYRYQLRTPSLTALALEGVAEKGADTLDGPCYDDQSSGTYTMERVKGSGE